MTKLTADADNIYDEHDDLVGIAMDNPALAKQLAAAPQIIERVVGWRERDWPEGFCRRTAELIADEVRAALKLADGESR